MPIGKLSGNLFLVSKYFVGSLSDCILQRFDVAVILQRFDVTVIAATSQMSQKLLLAEETESHPGGHFSRVQFIIKCCSG